jgi:para-aminobenzoate synthetase component 1
VDRVNSILIEEIKTSLSSDEIFRAFRNEPYPFLLDSGMDRQKLGRFSFIGYDPFLVFRSKNRNPFDELRALLREYSIDPAVSNLPFTCGAVGYLSYDLCGYLEDLPSRAFDDLSLPDCFMPFYDRSIVIDHLKDKVYIASSGFPEKDRARRLARAGARLDEARERIYKASMPTFDLGRARQTAKTPKELVSNFSREEYERAVLKAKEYIAGGDIYQVNLSQRFSCGLDADPYDLFARLKSINPAPFAAFLDFGDFQVVSSSPERFISKRGRHIHTRPIKGTRPRGFTPEEDDRLCMELVTSPKDRAEHVMIVDLERNDLGRVCEYGTIIPTEFIMLEPYSTVFHLTSTVSGTLEAGRDAIDCLKECFPGGSITGAPKIRSMEIIDELEPTKRSIYTGSIGYIGFDGNMDTSIVIRTFIIKGGKAYFQVGGGIVADSDPEMEYEETLHKARALIDALGVSSLSEVYK